MERTVSFYDVSKWQEKPHLQTGGTRNKVIIEDTGNGNLYYFKTSLKRTNDAYKYEFWSEIIASAIGAELGFNTLHYDIALNETEIGCLSKSMIKNDQMILSELVEYLCSCDANYNPEYKDSYTQYSFHFIKKALEVHGLENKIQHIIETIIFDSLIGNGDRHQENWGFIVFDIKKTPNTSIPSILKDFKELRQKNPNIPDILKIEFAPIYDNGSCLGRELLDAKIENMLKDDQTFHTYIQHDRCEIRWDTVEKINHFDLLTNIMATHADYRKIIIDRIGQIINKFDTERIQKITYEIDANLPKDLNNRKLPDNRKQFICRLLSIRFNKLKDIVK